MKAFTAQVTIEGKTLVAAGFAPFRVEPAGDDAWIVAGRDGGNCLAFPDGLRAIFDDEDPAILLCQSLNDKAPR